MRHHRSILYERGHLRTDVGWGSILLTFVAFLAALAVIFAVSQYPSLLAGLAVGALVRPMARLARRLARRLADLTHHTHDQRDSSQESLTRTPTSTE